MTDRMTDRIAVSSTASERIRRAAADLQRYLSLATGTFVPVVTEGDGAASDPGVRFLLGHRDDHGPAASLVAAGHMDPAPGAEGYALRRLDEETGSTVAIVGNEEAGAVYGTYALLQEAYGCGFYLGSEVVPSGTSPLLPDALDLKRAPAFATRGLLPWYDFLSGPSAWNLPDYKLYVDRMVRLGLNFLGLHVYSNGPVTRSQGAEPFLSFRYHGVGHDAVLDTTQTARWGYLPMRTSDFAYGTDRYFAGEVFGADAAVEAAGPHDAIIRAKALLAEALAYAKERGLRVCLGFEPSAIPAEIARALPDASKRSIRSVLGAQGIEEALDPRSAAAREILRLRLDDLLDTYPMVDAIWLWQNEDAAWTIRRRDGDVLPFEVDSLRQAYDYLKERAPGVQLVVSGWGAVHAHFDELHEALPDDVAFSALNHYLGASQTDEVYGRLGDRSRWPIPWLEDDATLWHPQYHVHRFRNDIVRAREFGCDGMIGIHWRTRVIDHTTAYFARALWEPDLDPADFYRRYAGEVVGVDGGAALAAAIEEIDRDHRWPGWFDEPTVARPEWDHGHSNEALAAFNPLPVADDLVADFSTFVAELDRAVAAAADAAARERVAYHRAQAGFVEHYVRSQRAARAVDAAVKAARDRGDRLSVEDTAAATRHLEAVYTAVRFAVEGFTAAMTTTADLGVLASLNQKYVVRACWQRYDALREVAAEPDGVPRPDLEASTVPLRVFVPVPPEVFDDEGLEIEAVVSDPEIASVTVRWAPLAGGVAGSAPLSQRGRGVWVGTVRADGPVRYWIEACATAGGRAVSPPGAPTVTYSAIRD